MLKVYMALQLILLPVAVVCLANGAIAEQPDFSKLDQLPRAEEKPWDIKKKLSRFPLERASNVGASAGGTFGALTGSTLRFRKGNRPTSNQFIDASNRETQWQQLERALAPTTEKQRANITIKTTKLFRYIGFKDLPDCSMDVLPLIANPGAAKSQVYTVRMTLKPDNRDMPAGQLTISKIPFGIALNGVLINRGDNDYWKNQQHSISAEILKNLRPKKQPTLIGFAADGYPIYGPYGYMQADNPQSALIELKTGYRIKKDVTADNIAPSTNVKTNTTDGAYTANGETKDMKPIAKYEYVDNLGDLDVYNGRTGVTPEYPEGTYYYVISNSFPYIPISFRGVPDKTFIPPGVEIPIPPPPPYHKLFNPSPRQFDF
jgi:hypothetical protein